jgi:hypothetical protein
MGQAFLDMGVNSKRNEDTLALDLEIARELIKAS